MSDDEQKAMIIRITNQHRGAHPQRQRPELTESNFEAMMERADALSKQRLHQPLGPFCRTSLDPEGAYDTPCSGWASLKAALDETRSEAAAASK